ncbi:MAG: N-acetylmuramic acid 6-phosphate etherase [Sphingobacteriaceae bacterium]
MERITEQASSHRNLEHKSISELVTAINKEDKTVALAIEKALPQVSQLIAAIVDKIEAGGRMFYVGAGSGGRLSVLDAIELPTTYGISKGVVNVVLAGGIDRLADAREEKEDDPAEGWLKLQEQDISVADIVIGVSASGITPFVLGCLKKCREAGVTTGCVVSNPQSPIAAQADFPLEVITGPEFITGSTRMKCGTAQKMLFDMISTTVMIRLGKVADNHMVNVALINDKITDRAVKMLMEKADITIYEEAKTQLLKFGSVKRTLDALSHKQNGNQ